MLCKPCRNFILEIAGIIFAPKEDVSYAPASFEVSGQPMLAGIYPLFFLLMIYINNGIIQHKYVNQETLQGRSGSTVAFGSRSRFDEESRRGEDARERSPFAFS